MLRPCPHPLQRLAAGLLLFERDGAFGLGFGQYRREPKHEDRPLLNTLR